MTQAEYDDIASELMALARSIEDSKRPGYTVGSEDVLANFKRVAERSGITTEQAWAVYFLKHIDAIVSIMTKPDLPVSEAAPGRFADAVNYLRLGFGLWRERSAVAASSSASPPRMCDKSRPARMAARSLSDAPSASCGGGTLAELPLATFVGHE